MSASPILRFLVAAAAFLALSEAALAQSPSCQRYRAELAALERGGGRQLSAAAERQRAEIGRLSTYYRSIGCGERGPFGGLFGGPPAECGSIAQRIRQMEASYASLLAQPDEFGNVDERRRQLMAAVQQTCNVEQQEASAPRSFLESLFGPPRGTSRAPEPQGMPMDPDVGSETLALGGRRLVCVRSCDGYFFPLVNGSRETADDLCQALCPGAETAAFATPGSDDAIRRAISLHGKPYATLPNAFKYQKSFDESCSCKKEAESWAQVLRRAESMIDQRRGDIIVTAQKSDEMARPKAAPVQPAKDPKAAAAEKKALEAVEKKANDAAEAKEAAEQGAAAPTASKESSGIGPQSIENSQIVGKNEGPKQDLTAGDGTKRTIRVIAPNIIPVPRRNP
jgi:hypothetical protein